LSRRLIPHLGPGVTPAPGTWFHALTWGLSGQVERELQKATNSMISIAKHTESSFGKGPVCTQSMEVSPEEADVANHESFQPGVFAPFLLPHKSRGVEEAHAGLEPGEIVPVRTRSVNGSLDLSRESLDASRQLHASAASAVARTRRDSHSSSIDWARTHWGGGSLEVSVRSPRHSIGQCALPSPLSIAPPYLHRHAAPCPPAQPVASPS
jgi:hypothetical protein